MLKVSDLTLAYGGEPVLAGVNLEVADAQFVSLVGPSGSGKSSILRAVAGLQAPQAGKVDLAVGRDAVGILFQDDALLPWRTARENVMLGLRIRGAGDAAAASEADAWLARLGLTGFEERYPRHLSGGQRKRVALAQVLALRPRLLLMDEPFASLDAIVRHRVTHDLLNLVEGEGISVLLVTHDLEEAQILSDVIYLLSRGPRAEVRRRYEVPIPRPRDLIKARLHASFGPLLERLWQDLSLEVDGCGQANEAA
ncbi:MAG: ABC transporter ATP-binding protein [Proteobacteria bacterium]|nr:ABC transporter ATP-binding protein [Pseudomonadota bacterium]